MSFFGTGGSSSGFNFGGDQPQQSRFPSPGGTQGFNFGTPTASAGNVSNAFFGTPSQTTNSGFGFGTPANAPGSGSGFLFNTPARTSAPSAFSFGTQNSGAFTSNASGFGFVAPNATQSFGGNLFNSPTPAFSTGNLSFGTPSVAAATVTAASTSTTATSIFGGGSIISKPATVPSSTGLSSSGFGMTGGFSFNQPSTTTTTAASFTGITTSAPTFGLGSTFTASSTPLSFNSAIPAQQNKGLSFGTPVTTSSTTASLLSTVPATTASSQNAIFQFGSTTAPTTGLLTTSAGVTSLPSFGLSKTSVDSSGTSGILGSAPASSVAGGFTLAKPTSTLTAVATSTPVAAISSLSGLLVPTPTTTISTTLPTTGLLGTTTAISTGFSLGTTAKPLSSSGSILGTATNITSAISQPTQTTVVTTTQTLLSSAAATTTVTTGAELSSPIATINFRKLEEDINKWTLELEEQEGFFLTQATQVNAWDRILISNGEKITQLSDALERVKIDQEHLDQEIDFIRSQQSELEELLTVLENSVESLPPLSIHQHADLEREQTFQMAENIDSQLRLMSTDLKEIIEHLNSASGSQSTNDPIHQIGKILNSHTDSLQLIDQNTNLLRNKVSEVSDMLKMCCRDQETVLHLSYM